MFTNEEIILENEIKRKDTVMLCHTKDDYFEPLPTKVIAGLNMFHGSSMLVVTNKETK